MRFGLNILGMEVFSVEFAWPSKGVFNVPDFIPSEFEYINLDEED